jgi:hypothetical protein
MISLPRGARYYLHLLIPLLSTTFDLTTAFLGAPILWSQQLSQQSTYHHTNIALSSCESASKEETCTLFSPCKINLFLRILGKRDDGYHDLASLFQAIGFGDTLELTQIQDGDADVFTCNMEGVPTDSSNLVLRAIQLVRDKTGVQQFYKTNLIKECPAQAGLGGGSANAATAMWGANELMGRPATLQQVRFSAVVFVVVATEMCPKLTAIKYAL